MIAVKEPRVVQPGFEGFAMKAGVWHVQPPPGEILAEDAGRPRSPRRLRCGQRPAPRAARVALLRLGRRRSSRPGSGVLIRWFARSGQGGVVLMRPLLYACLVGVNVAVASPRAAHRVCCPPSPGRASMAHPAQTVSLEVRVNSVRPLLPSARGVQRDAAGPRHSRTEPASSDRRLDECPGRQDRLRAAR